jgi:ELWxxDGT repeat protein
MFLQGLERRVLLSAVMVTDVRPEYLGSWPMRLTPFAGAMYFTADDGTSGRALWRTDGTAGGTVMVEDPGLAFEPYSALQLEDGKNLPLTTAKGKLYFSWETGGHEGMRNFTSDGSVGGAEEFGAIPFAEAHHGFRALELGDSLVLAGLVWTGRAGGDQFALWRSDGTAAGTTLIKLLPSSTR